MSLGPEWKYKVTIENPNWYEAQHWCEVIIGEFGDGWYKLGIDPAEWVIDGNIKTTWLFKEEKYATMFILRWH